MSLSASSSFLAGILLQALDDDAVVHGGVHHLDLGDAQFGDLLDHRLGQRLEGARDDEAFFLVHGVLDQDPVLQVLELLGFLDREFLDVVKQLENFLVGAAGFFAVVLALVLMPPSTSRKLKRAEKRGGQKFPAAFFAVEINVKQIAGVELRLIPGTAVGNDAEGVQHFAVGMLRRLEGDARRAVQLARRRRVPRH